MSLETSTSKNTGLVITFAVLAGFTGRYSSQVCVILVAPLA